jgi:hypothetical protein
MSKIPNLISGKLMSLCAMKLQHVPFSADTGSFPGLPLKEADGLVYLNIFGSKFQDFQMEMLELPEYTVLLYVRICCQYHSDLGQMPGP